MAIEVEARSFISPDKYKELLEYMEKNAKSSEDDYQITYYFKGPADLRIQRNNKFAKLWLKKGKIHDKHREEMEVKFDREDFKELEKLLKALGYDVEIKWFRQRNRFQWDGMKVTIDYTKGYGHIIELEKIAKKEEEKDKIYEELKEKLKSLGVEISPREKFEERFKHYKKNWRSLVEEN